MKSARPREPISWFERNLPSFFHLGRLVVARVSRFVEAMTRLGAWGSERGRWVRLVPVLGYLGLELAYVFSLPLVMDEFANAKHIARMFESVPYRDYAPYKTLLGYLVQAPALYSSSDPWNSMIAVKVEMALLVATFLLFFGEWLARRYGELPATGALLLLVTHSTFLERSAALRVDMLASLAGTGALLAIASGRTKWGGALAALSVLATQKGVYFPLSAGLALGVVFLLQRTKVAFKEVLSFVGAGVAVGLAYFSLAVLVGDLETVVSSIFFNPHKIAFEALYPDTIRQFWRQTLGRNAFFYGVALAGAVLSLTQYKRDEPSLFLGIGSAFLMTFCYFHKQPWPYFFVFFLPSLSVLVAICLSQFRRATVPALVVGSAVLFFAIDSVHTRAPIALSFSQNRQKQIVRRAASLLGEGGYYLAGVEVLWQRKHVPGVEWYDFARSQYYATHPEEFLGYLENGPRAEIVIENHRVHGFPPPAVEWIERNYISAGSNIRFFGPQVDAGRQVVHFGPGGRFQTWGASLHLEGLGRFEHGAFVEVPPGKRHVTSEGRARLILWPGGKRPDWFQKAPNRALAWPAYLY